MELSELMTTLRSRGVKISSKTNYKKYYGTFPNYIKFEVKSGLKWDEMRSTHTQVAKAIKNAFGADECRVRNEYYTLSIFCMNIVPVLEKLSTGLLKKYAKIVIGVMPEDVQAIASTKAKLPKSEISVVKNLPYETYRYRIHWPTTAGKVRKIGQEAIDAIVDHIDRDPNSKSLNPRTSRMLKEGKFWTTSYFYTNSEDILCIISLINPLFIKRIEEFKTLEEINEEATSRSTN